MSDTFNDSYTAYITDLTTSIPSSYVDYKLGINNNYKQDKINLAKNRTNIYSDTNKIELKLTNDEETINELNESIMYITQENKELSSKLSLLENENNGAEGALKETTTLYTELYIQNIILFIIILSNISIYIIKTN
jgi:hypothetical protein